MDHREGVARVEALIRDVRPDVVVTFGPDGLTGHPDHVAVSRWTIEAWQRAGHGELLLATMTDAFRIEHESLHERLGLSMPLSVPDTEVVLRVTPSLAERSQTTRARRPPLADGSIHRTPGLLRLPRLVGRRVLPCADACRPAVGVADRDRRLGDMSTTLTTTPRHNGLHAGIRAMLPLAISCAPFGVAVGATIAASNVHVAPTLAAALLMFGGSAQLAAVEMLDAGATPVLIVAAAAIINARFVAYSAGLAPLFPTTSRVIRAVMATTLVDQSYLVTSIDATNHDRPEPERVRFYLGASATIGLISIAAQVLGVIAGTALPNATNLGAAAPISLAA